MCGETWNLHATLCGARVNKCRNYRLGGGCCDGGGHRRRGGYRICDGFKVCVGDGDCVVSSRGVIISENVHHRLGLCDVDSHVDDVSDGDCRSFRQCRDVQNRIGLGAVDGHVLVVSDGYSRNVIDGDVAGALQIVDCCGVGMANMMSC